MKAVRALKRTALLSITGVILFAACKSNDVASSNNATVNIGQACSLDASASTADNGCGGGVCLAGYCRQPCSSDATCDGEAGTGGVCLSSRGVSGCALMGELNCTQGAGCGDTFLCGTDSACHTKCTTDEACLNGQHCTGGACYTNGATPDASGLEGGSADATASGSSGSSSGGSSSGSGSGSSSGSGSGSSSGGSSSGTMGPDGSACPSAQTQFGNIAVGDANPNFTSSVGVRTPNQLLVFSGYNGPDPNDGGLPDAGGYNFVYWQAFDPATAKSLGPAQPLMLTDSGTLGSILLDDVSIAPTGEIALLYTHITTTAGNILANGLSAAFFAPTADAGSSGPQVQQVVQLESANVGEPPQDYGPWMGQPHAIWSTLSKAFVFSWVYYQAENVKVKKFLPNGASAGGDTDVVPTNQAGDAVDYESGSVATSGNLFGVSYLGSGIYPTLTLLDALGNEVGTPLEIDIRQPPSPAAGGYYWTTAAGTNQGFVTFLSGAPVREYFVPAAAADGGVPTPADGGVFSGFVFPGSALASLGRTISDDTGGTGGVGAVFLYDDGASFLYVNADGITHLGPTQVISHARGVGDVVAITEFGGSFGISLYSAAEHLTRMAASGCR